MGKKKGSKKGKKGKGKGKKDGPAKAEKNIELMTRFEGGYLKRCTARFDQPPLTSVVNELKQSIKNGTNYIQCLVAGEDLVGPEATSRLDPFFTAVLETGYPFMSQLYIWNTTLRNAEMLVLTQWMEKRCTLETLEFMDNSLSEFACKRLGEVLSFNNVVKSLSILHNDIGDEGATALCNGMAFNQKLEKLHLEYCDIEADGCESIGRLIATNGSLQAIYLNGNNVESAGAMHLIRGVACNRHLTRLELQDNAIDTFATEGADEDAVTLIESMKEKLKTNTSFAYLDLFENNIGDTGGEAVVDLYGVRKEAGLPTLNIRVAPQMKAELYATIAKSTKWVAGGGKSKGGAKKKKGGKKKKKK